MLAFLVGAAANALVAVSALAHDPGAGAPVQYDVAFDNAAHHEARISVTYRRVSGPLKLRMARSSPGRYALHEFAKNVYSVSAQDGAGRPLAIERTEPYSWTVPRHDGTVKVTYTLFGDHGDGTYAQIDVSHAHLNMPASFMWATGYDDRPIRVRFHRRDPSWKIATQLPPAAEPDTFWAPNLQYFMDSPTELSDFAWREWQVADGGRTYTFRLAVHDAAATAEDVDRLAGELKQVVPQHIALFGEAPRFDFGTYTFIADYMPQDSFDGMEHRNSTFLTGAIPLKAGNLRYLDAASHEFTHAWNVKRLRPAELEPFDYTRANPTPSLWLAEGFTNYYGPLMVRRSGQSSIDAYLADLGRTLSFVVTAPGRAYGSPHEMSIRAPFLDAAAAIDETNPNTVTSYYPYGQIVGLALDLDLRARPGNLTLDDYMRRLWRTHGAPERTYTEKDLKDELAGLTGDARFADDFFKASIDGSALPDFGPLLAQAGLKLRPKAPTQAWLGATQVKTLGSQVLLDQAPAPGTALYLAGVEKGDRIESLGGTEIADAGTWQEALKRLKPGDKVGVRFVQRGRPGEAELTVAADPALEVVRYEAAGLTPTEAQLSFRNSWLGPDLKAPAATR